MTAEVPLTQEDFEIAVSQLNEGIGVSSQSIDFPKAYRGYLFVTAIFGAVNLEVTEVDGCKKVAMRPVFD